MTGNDTPVNGTTSGGRSVVVEIIGIAVPGSAAVNASGAGVVLPMDALTRDLAAGDPHDGGSRAPARAGRPQSRAAGRSAG